MTVEPIGAREAAAILMAMLQRRGATFELTAEGDLRWALNGADASVSASAADIAMLVQVLREEIEQLLRDDRTVH